MAKVHLPEFRDDVVRVARKHQAPINQIAKGLGISEATLHSYWQNLKVRSTDMWYFAFHRHRHRRPVRGSVFLGNW